MIENLINEQWKPIEGYPNYEVSNLGRIKSLNYNHTNTEKLLKPQKDGCGYLFVSLCKDGKIKLSFVHRLVAQAFIENPNNLPQVNHKSEVKTENFVENLEWCNRKHNCNFGKRNEKIAEKLTNGITSKKVYQYTPQGELIKIWGSTAECGRNGFNYSNIASCCRGKLKTSQGYIWSYLPKV